MTRLESLNIRRRPLSTAVADRGRDPLQDPRASPFAAPDTWNWYVLRRYTQ